MKKVVLILLCFSLTFLGGCWDQLIVEELALVLSMGFDPDPEDPELFLMTVTNPAFSETAIEETKKLSAKGYSLSNGFYNMQRQRDRLLVLGQVSTLIFSEEAAKNGLLNQILHEVDQQRDMNPNADILVVRGTTAQEVVQLEPVEEARVAVYLSNVLDRNCNNGLVPRISASGYWFRYSTAGLDPVVPVIELIGPGEQKNGVALAGLAAFDSQGKMKGVISDHQVVHFMMLTGQNRRGRFTTKLEIDGKHRDTSMYIKDVSTKIKSQVQDGSARIAISMEVDVDIINVRWDVNVVEEEADKKLESILARDIQGNALDMIRQSQAWGSDILGLGQYVRIQNPQWFRGKDWGKEYKNSDITLEVKVNVKRIGTLVNPLY